MNQVNPSTSPEVKLKRLVEVSCELNSTLDLNTMLQIIMDAATELTATEAASVLLLDPATRDLYFAAASQGSTPELIGMVVPLDTSIAGAILKSERPMVVPDVRQDPRHHSGTGQAIDFETRSLLGVPMLAEGRKVGVLEAINKISGGFSSDDVDTLNTLASIAAIAIHRAGLIAQLRDANEQLSQLDQLKTNFIAIASHELRTPLAIILGYLSIIQEDVGGQEVEKVLQASIRLRSLMEGMFNLRYIDTGQANLNLTRLCLSPMVSEVVGQQQGLTEARGLTIDWAPPEETYDVLADQEALQLVLNNLISNAIKFTPAGGHINVSLTRRAAEIWVSVADDGIGIPESHHQRIFDRFYQVEDHLTRGHEGLGIGLAVAQELLAVQNGRIWVESQEGQGSTFTFALPLAASSE